MAHQERIGVGVWICDSRLRCSCRCPSSLCVERRIGHDDGNGHGIQLTGWNGLPVSGSDARSLTRNRDRERYEHGGLLSFCAGKSRTPESRPNDASCPFEVQRRAISSPSHPSAGRFHRRIRDSVLRSASRRYRTAVCRGRLHDSASRRSLHHSGIGHNQSSKWRWAAERTRPNFHHYLRCHGERSFWYRCHPGGNGA